MSKKALNSKFVHLTKDIVNIRAISEHTKAEDDNETVHIFIENRTVFRQGGPNAGEEDEGEGDKVSTRWKRIATQYESPVKVVEAVNDNDDHQPTSDDAEEVKEE